VEIECGLPFFFKRKNFQKVVDYPNFERFVEIMDHPPFIEILIYSFFLLGPFQEKK
jgi:hypothetical protein